jgi:alpha-glucosidase (family GH31 glycosyl hydrolase)
MAILNQTHLSLALLFSIGCASKDGTSTATTIGADFGSLQVWVDETAGVIVERDGTELAWIPPERFRFRDATATYQSTLGSFKIDEDPAGDWTAASKVGGLLGFSDRIQFDLLDERDRPVANGRLVAESDGHISLVVESDQNRIQAGLDCIASDHFAGLGSHAMDVDHRGRDVFLFVSEPGVGKSETNAYTADWMITGQRSAASIPVPAWVSSRGTAWRLETDAYAELDLCKTDAEVLNLEVWESRMELHLFDGPTPLEARANMTAHAGRPALPAPWAFAPWNDAIFGTENVLNFAEFLAENEIPSSAIWSEDWRGGHWQSYGYRIDQNWHVDEELYPDYEGMVSTLDAMGIAHQVYFNPNVNSQADIFEEARDAGYLIANEDGTTHMAAGAEGALAELGFVDLTNPDAWDYTKGLLHEVAELGADGWMADYAEWTPIDGIEFYDGSDPETTHNRYPQLWQELNAEVAAELGKPNQMGIYYRSGHRSAPSTAGLVWAGDQRTSFDPDDGLPTVIPMGLGLAAAGVPFYGHDIAGYQFIGNDPTTKELFFRWTALGALSPIMRTHHGIKVDDNWDLADDDESTAHWKRYAELHIQLFPYVWSLANQAVSDGTPLWIPMGLVHPDDAEAWAVTDQYFYGDALLVAPVVTESATDDLSTERSIYFPEGRFVPFQSEGDAIEGPATVVQTVAITEIPVYLTAGGIVPMTAEPAKTLREAEGVVGLESTEGDRIVYVGLGADGAFEEASGASYALEGTGTEPMTATLTGNGTVEGEGWTFTTALHPDERTVTVIAR